MNDFVKNRIDPATLYQFVGPFHHAPNTHWTDWDRSVALSLTVMLVGDPDFLFSISPSPEKAKDASGPYGVFVDSVKRMGAARDETSDPDRAAQALTCTKQMIRNRPEEIRTVYLKLLQDDRNFKPWLQGGVSDAWIEHSQRLGGLFNPTLIPEISLVLERPESDLVLSLQDSQNPALLRGFAARGELEGEEGFEIDP